MREIESAEIAVGEVEEDRWTDRARVVHRQHLMAEVARAGCARIYKVSEAVQRMPVTFFLRVFGAE